MKTYVLMVSATFPAYHDRKGDLTLFAQAIGNVLEDRKSVNEHHQGVVHICSNRKIHTIRKNYAEWKRRETEINEGRAVLSIRQWNGSRFVKGAIQTELYRLTKIGVQKAEFKDDFLHEWEIDGKTIDCLSSYIFENDGLTYSDMVTWFVDGNYKPNEPLAIIHFTEFRY